VDNYQSICQIGGYGWTAISPSDKIGNIGGWLSAYIAIGTIWMDLVRLIRVMPSALQVLTVVEDYLLALKIKEP
jgi:hypothetical protein